MQPALLNEAGQSLTYGELQEKITLISKLISKRKLVFLLGKNDFLSVQTYLACLEKDTVPLLLDPVISASMLSNLVDLYRPTYIFISKEKSNLFFDSEILYESNDYLFLKNKFSDDSDLNPNLALLLTTSGSSGSPKLVRLSKDNIFSNTDSIIK
jgi:long-subunit acyl-CoA synthetase (AMP-forming)